MCVAKRAFGRLPQTATIRSLVCSCEMRPFAFLEPRAFFNTDPDFRAQIELNQSYKRGCPIRGDVKKKFSSFLSKSGRMLWLVSPLASVLGSLPARRVLP